MLNKKLFFYFNICVICFCLYCITSLFYKDHLSHTSCVSLTSDKLYYSGLDASRNGHIVGNYYFSFKDNVCQFYLLKAETNPPSIKSVSKLNGTFSEYSHQEYTALLSKLSEKLHLDETDLSKYTSNTLFSEIHTSIVPSLVIFCTMIVCSILWLLNDHSKQKHIFN